jgi:hypothetical protein
MGEATSSTQALQRIRSSIYDIRNCAGGVRLKIPGLFDKHDLDLGFFLAGRKEIAKQALTWHRPLGLDSSQRFLKRKRK